MASGIYEIVCTANGRRYCGSAVDLDRRWKEHTALLRSGKHHSQHMQRCFNKHSQESLVFRPLLICAVKDLLFYEQRAIDVLKPEFNSSPTAGSQLGYRHREDTRRKMSASRRRDFSPMKGKKHTPEAIALMSANRKGKGGGQRTPERCAKISAALKGRVVSLEQRAKISATLMGHKQSNEQIEKRRQKLRGRKMPAGFAEKARARMLGTKFSAQTRIRIAKAQAVLTEDQVRKIRSLVSGGESYRRIAEAVGTSRFTVADIACGRKYKWVIP